MDGVVRHGHACASRQAQVPSHDGVMAHADAPLARCPQEGTCAGSPAYIIVSTQIAD